MSFQSETSACSIAGPLTPPTPKSEFDDASIVFIGEFQSSRVIERALDKNFYLEGVEATFKIATMYKGFYRSEGRLIKIRTGMGGGDCGISGLGSGPRGTKWLIYAHFVLEKDGGVLIFTSIAEPTFRLSETDKKYIDFLNTLPKAK